MSFKKFKKQYLSSKDLDDADNILRVINTLQDNIENSITPLVDKTQNDSQVLTNINLIQGQNNIINHTLARSLIGYYIILKSAQADIWDTQQNNLSPDLTLWLSTSSDVLVNLIVF